MQNWFECKVKFEKQAEEGKLIKSAEAYVIEAINFTDAETRVIEEVSPFVSATGEFEVANIRKVRLSDIFRSNGDKWYKAKLMYIIPDEEKGIEKRTASFVLVQASDLYDAVKLIIKEMGATAINYEITSVAETIIMDVLPFKATDIDQPQAE